MKNFKVKIKIQGLTGDRVNEYSIKAKTLRSATKKAWEIIGNQSGEILSISEGV